MFWIKVWVTCFVLSLIGVVVFSFDITSIFYQICAFTLILLVIPLVIFALYLFFYLIWSKEKVND